MLGQRLRRWTNITSASGECIVLAVNPSIHHTITSDSLPHGISENCQNGHTARVQLIHSGLIKSALIFTCVSRHTQNKGAPQNGVIFRDAPLGILEGGGGGARRNMKKRLSPQKSDFFKKYGRKKGFAGGINEKYADQNEPTRTEYGSYAI